MVQTTPPPQKLSRLPHPSGSAARWQAVVNRDATTTTFVYAVITTKIYCRPCCPSRLARRANVRFYDKPSQAEAAGFRPCKRCKPENLQAAISPQVRLIHAACQTIKSEVAAGSKPTLSKLAEEAGLTPSHFHRVFKKVMGVTPGKYAVELLGSSNTSENNDNSHYISGVMARQPLGDEDLALFQDWVQDENMLLYQPGSLDRADGIGCADIAGDAPWNDFDALIAAEDRYSTMQEFHSLVDGFDFGSLETELVD